MAKGNTAKEYVEKKIIEAFGSDFVGISDKKIYVYADDGGERVQIAISLTCPKVQIECGPAPKQTVVNDNSAPWEEAPAPVITETPTEPDQKELDNLAAMLEKFGL